MIGHPSAGSGDQHLRPTISLWLLCIFFTVFSACRHDNGSPDDRGPDESGLAAGLQASTAYLGSDPLDRALSIVFERVHYQMAWAQDRDSIRAKQLVRLAEDPCALGIPPGTLPGLEVYRQTAGNRLSGSGSGALVIDEWAYTAMLADICHYTLTGRLMPRHEDSTVHHSNRIADILTACAASEDPGSEVLSGVPAPIAGVLGMVRDFCAVARFDLEGTEIPQCVPDSTACLSAVKAALWERGLLPVSDSSPAGDTELDRALRRFQEMNGLLADGKVGAQTRKAFSRNDRERLGQLMANLHRARREEEPAPAADLLEVNLPEMALRLYLNGKEVSRHKVVIGKRSGHQTPLFKDTLNEIVVNPDWRVPYSIATKEILPDQQDDPSYLERHNYRVLDRFGEEVDPADIDWYSLDVDHFPYRIVQRPGGGNALGRIKFLFPNRYMVYIHDTPSKHLFQSEERDFSHGCIRVESPFELARLILDRTGFGMDPAGLRELIDSTELHSIPVHPGIPVAITYRSVIRNEKGLVFFRDIYGLDSKWVKRAKNMDHTKTS